MQANSQTAQPAISLAKAQELLTKAGSPQLLLALADKLSKDRMTQTALSLQVLLHKIHESPTAELTYAFCQQLNWPQPVTSILLKAAYCTELQALVLPDVEHRLLRYPPLRAARLLKTVAPVLARLLAGCYATERNQPYWQQSAASALLTLTTRLTKSAEHNNVQLQLNERLLLSNCEHELALLRLYHVFTVSQITALPARADWLTDPAFATLISTKGKALQALLSQSEALKAPVLRKATELNRQQQKVKSLSHAVNLIGQQQLVPVLAEADLNNKLSQLHHPQHQLHCKLADCVSNSLQLLDTGRLLPAQYRVLAYCLLAPLWFSSNGYLSAAGGKDMPTVLADFHSLNQAANRQWQDALLLHYQLPALTAIPDILFPQKPSELAKQRIALTVQIAVLSAAAIYNDHHHSLLNKALLLLNAASENSLNADQHLTDVACHSHSFCPLLLSL